MPFGSEVFTYFRGNARFARLQGCHGDQKVTVYGVSRGIDDLCCGMRRFPIQALTAADSRTGAVTSRQRVSVTADGTSDGVAAR